MKLLLTDHKHRVKIATLSVIFYLVQALIPLGFMPASLADEGTLLKLCPSGVSDAVMAILHSKQNDQHSIHAHHQHHDHTEKSPNNPVNHSASSICDYGATASGADLALLETSGLARFSTQTIKQQNLIHVDVIGESHRKQRSRAPPAA